eukprot:CAMPEP_0197246570 /NCGR_PEP_ID=MMETSP1429-20130617/15904_1 /TAXON_ID=49237 /ORGANISM="Chaetoceros  sp., Strain UNC1202" /LENGTH=108 /DNA_ID=CAMNT_0042707261 /DNA_START=148 /DNA_END=471 /DNA_ORIENTATION=+
MIRSVVSATSSTIKRAGADMFAFFRPPVSPQLALAANGTHVIEPSSIHNSGSPTLADCLWLAVPKRKVSRSKKRMKTTVQKRIKRKDHIIEDSRTGEVTLRHRLPFNW